MKKKFALSRSVLGIVSALCIGLFCAQLTTASADEPSRASSEAGAVDSASVRNGDGTSSTDQSEPDQSKVKQDPATRSAVPCNCSGSGSGCAGACPNAPGPKRHCRNLAPSGKPKMCSCVP
ncbi:MAG TPA: hypothetical protein PLY80_08320 [Pseudomonadota bacterium]|nr:hypothetical protein [Pseudomonadota bacterium]